MTQATPEGDDLSRIITPFLNLIPQLLRAIEQRDGTIKEQRARIVDLEDDVERLWKENLKLEGFRP